MTSDYLIAADGVNGASREKVGIGRHGPGVLQHWMNVIFATDMKPTLQGRALRSVFLTDINGTFVPRDGGRWLIAVQFLPEAGQRPEDFNEAHCLAFIRRGAGRSDLNAKIVDIRPWEVAAYIADQYSKSRVFLLGDAAHVMPPTGGFGGNTGIHDAHNIAWKLEAVLRNKAGKALLDTYDEERRPIGERTLAQSLARLQAWFKDPSKKLPASEPIIDDYAVIFGYRYPSGAFIADGDPTDEIFENPRTPSGAPGSRAPHVITECNGQRLSTIDLFAGKWVLVAGPDGGTWLDAASRIGAARDLNLQCYRVGADLRDVSNRWSASYGVGVDGAVLVRPDGFIAWRAKDARSKPEATLREAFEQLTFRDSQSERRAS